jgi:hypothetical protein
MIHHWSVVSHRVTRMPFRLIPIVCRIQYRSRGRRVALREPAAGQQPLASTISISRTAPQHSSARRPWQCLDQAASRSEMPDCRVELRTSPSIRTPPYSTPTALPGVIAVDVTKPIPRGEKSTIHAVARTSASSKIRSVHNKRAGCLSSDRRSVCRSSITSCGTTLVC